MIALGVNTAQAIFECMYQQYKKEKDRIYVTIDDGNKFNEILGRRQ